jgi:hypothetical protein
MAANSAWTDTTSTAGTADDGRQADVDAPVVVAVPGVGAIGRVDRPRRRGIWTTPADRALRTHGGGTGTRAIRRRGRGDGDAHAGARRRHGKSHTQVALYQSHGCPLFEVGPAAVETRSRKGLYVRSVSRLEARAHRFGRFMIGVFRSPNGQFEESESFTQSSISRPGRESHSLTGSPGGSTTICRQRRIPVAPTNWC